MAGKSKSKLILSKTWASELRKSPGVIEMNHKAGKDFAREMDLKAKTYRGGSEGQGWFYTGAKYGSAPIWGAISKVWIRTPWVRKYSDTWAAQAASKVGLKRGRK